MANKSKKEKQTIGQVVTIIIDRYSFEDLVHAFEVLKEKIRIEAEDRVQKGKTAASILNSIEGEAVG